MKLAPASWEGYGRSILRIILAFTFSLHGYRHLFGLFPSSGGRRAAIPMALDALPPVAGYLEISGGLLLLLGLFTRLTTLVLCAELLAAYFYFAVPRGPWPIRNGGNEVLLYLLVFMYFAAQGGGAWSVDRFRSNRRNRTRANFQPAGVTLGAVGLAALALLATAPANAQPDKPLMVEDVFKNVQVLKGIPVNEFMTTMGFFSASLGFNCTGCHTTESLGNWEKYGDDIPVKRTARRMILMVNTINKDNFGGRRVVTCYSCHRGAGLPKAIPSLAEQYGSPPPEDPDEVEITRQASPAPTADQVLDKYLQALGGADRLARLTSFTAKGTYGGYDTDFLKVPLEVFAKASGQRTSIAHTPLGDSTTTFDGRTAWIAAWDKPVPLLALPPGPDLDGVKLDADLSFPGRIKQALSQWRTGFPLTAIDDHDVHVIQGTTAGGSRVKLFFDKESGLLVRMVRYAESAVGINPTQIDYADYRDVAGVKMPFHWTVTWTDGQSNIDLSEVQPNVPIDAVKFSRPPPAARPPVLSK